MKAINIISILLLLALMAGGVFHVLKVKKLQQEAYDLQNQLAKVDTVVVLDSVTVSKLTLLVDNLRIENMMLAKKYLKTTKEVIAYNKLVVTLQDSIKKLSTADTTIDDHGTQVQVRNFRVEKDPFLIEGVFMKTDPWFITFNTLAATISLELAAVENKNGLWETYVTTGNSNVKVASIDARYKKFDKKPNKFLLGVQGTMWKDDLSASMFAGYERSALSVGYGTNGLSLGAMYFILR